MQVDPRDNLAVMLAGAACAVVVGGFGFFVLSMMVGLDWLIRYLQ